jgi:SNF2 family DNA or RNA helicase
VAPSNQPPPPPPPLAFLRSKPRQHSLRPYQLVGLDWLANMHKKRLNGILVIESDFFFSFFFNAICFATWSYF